MKKDYSEYGAKIKKYFGILTTILFALYTIGFICLWVLLKDVDIILSMALLFGLVIGYAFCILCVLAIFYFTYGFGEFLENYKAEQEDLLYNFDKILKARLKKSKEDEEK